MKRIFAKIIFTCVIVVAFTSACDEDNLDLAPLASTEEDYFTNEAEFERFLIGIYAKLVRFYAVSSLDGAQNVGTNLYQIQALPGDDLTAGGQIPFEIFDNISPTTGHLGTFYAQCFSIISRASTMLEKLDEAAPEAYQNAELKNYHRGETLFLRSYAYYLLWNVFGTAPLVTKRVTTQAETTPPSSTGTQLLDQAITDLQEAVTLLPASWPDAQRGRITRNAAYGMLGKNLVFRASATNNTADYSAAVSAFNNISGASLVPNFADNFAFDTENNPESLFEFQAHVHGDNLWVGDPDNWEAIGVMSTYWEFFVPNGGVNFGYGPLRATQKLVDAFDPQDPRLPLTLNPDDRTIVKYVSRNSKINDGYSVNNARILRYADVLLLKAEAILMSGGSKAEAIAAVNEVRTRARNMNPGPGIPADYSTAETDTNTILEWIKNERFIELAAEAQRWYDVRRWFLGEKAANPGATISEEFFNSDSNPEDFVFKVENVYFPIPTSETDNNPNISQNPGY
jgi:starch-binding outer membrane protein, SusD/RagB family